MSNDFINFEGVTKNFVKGINLCWEGKGGFKIVGRVIS